MPFDHSYGGFSHMEIFFLLAGFLMIGWMIINLHHDMQAIKKHLGIKNEAADNGTDYASTD